MPNYYNPYTYSTNLYGYSTPQPVIPPMQQSYNSMNSGNTYMTSVDGEMAARAWQPPTPLPPNAVIPLWDLDGQHVYFKSTDAYGRMNPIRKGRVVFEDEQTNLPQGVSETATEPEQKPVIDTSKFVTKEDFEGLRHELQDMLRMQRQASRASYIPENNADAASKTNQNGSGRRGDVK